MMPTFQEDRFSFHEGNSVLIISRALKNGHGFSSTGGGHSVVVFRAKHCSHSASLHRQLL